MSLKRLMLATLLLWAVLSVGCTDGELMPPGASALIDLETPEQREAAWRDAAAMVRDVWLVPRPLFEWMVRRIKEARDAELGP